MFLCKKLLFETAVFQNQVFISGALCKGTAVLLHQKWVLVLLAVIGTRNRGGNVLFGYLWKLESLIARKKQCPRFQAVETP